MKLDLHVHTFYSDDAVASPERLVMEAKNRGLDGIAVTDHNTTGAWKRALSAGKEHGIRVIRGEEVRVTHEGEEIGEVLVYFMDKEIKRGEICDVLDKARQQGALVSVAHPFDYFRNRFKRIEEFKHDFDAVEAFNSRVVIPFFNQRALKFARRNHLPVTAGSDAHCLYELGNAYTDAKARNLEEFRRAIEKGRTGFGGKITNPLIHSISSAAKVGLKRFILQT